RLVVALRPAEVRHDHDARAALEREADRRQRRVDARRARDAPVLDGHVQILADQHAPAGELEIGHLADCQGHALSFSALVATKPSRDRSPANTTVVSSMRFEKPHSLSYHAQILTSLPSLTFVSVAS